jgi:type II secretory pathway predicted ATPase ExeA
VLFEHEKARHILLILDCCYAGMFRESAPDRYLDELHQRLRFYFTEPAAQHPTRSGEIRLALTATGETGAREQDGRGLLTGALLTALRGKALEAINERGEITFTSLFGYLERTMPAEQRPHFFGAGAGLVLATYPEHSAQCRDEQRAKERLADREKRLRSLRSDHQGFLHDRLASFVGRVPELVAVQQQIAHLQPTGGYLAITGPVGQGKSSLIAKLIEATAQEQGRYEHVAFHFIPLTPPPNYQVALLRNLMARLALKHQISDLYLASDSRAALCESFPRLLKDIAEQGGQEIIFIDGLDQLQPDQQTGLRDLSFLPQGPGNPPQGIVFVLGTRPNETLRPLELLKPLKEYPLPDVSRADFHLILRHRGVTLESSLANRFHEMLKKNALYLDLVAQEFAARQESAAKCPLPGSGRPGVRCSSGERRQL